MQRMCGIKQDIKPDMVGKMESKEVKERNKRRSLNRDEKTF